MSEIPETQDTWLRDVDLAEVYEDDEPTETETDQQADDTVALRGLSDEALEYVLSTYDVKRVD